MTQKAWIGKWGVQNWHTPWNGETSHPCRAGQNKPGEAECAPQQSAIVKYASQGNGVEFDLDMASVKRTKPVNGKSGCFRGEGKAFFFWIVRSSYTGRRISEETSKIFSEIGRSWDALPPENITEVLETVEKHEIRGGFVHVKPVDFGGRDVRVELYVIRRISFSDTEGSA